METHDGSGERFGDPLGRLLQDRLQRQIDRLQLRTRRIVEVLDSTHVAVDGRRCVNFAANNYLGLTHHPRLISCGQSLRGDHGAGGAGSGAAGLITGFTRAHGDAEANLAKWKSTQAAVLLPSGYQANLAAVQTFAALADAVGGRGGSGVRFLLDKLAHASLIDAVRSSNLPFRVFPHNHLTKLQRLLAEADDEQLQVVVTESIFSMDGDAADLAGLANLKKQFNFALLLDEAHASGVYGDGGSGLLAEKKLEGLADVIVCTLSKAAGGIGGAVCASKLFCDGLLNFGRAYIYSTAVPQWVARMAETAIEIMRDEPWRQQRVRSHAARVREELGLAPGDSPIIPILFGGETTTMETAERLRTEGMLVGAIRPPTVAPGTCRLRVTLSCDHTDEEIGDLINRLAALKIAAFKRAESADPLRQSERAAS